MNKVEQHKALCLGMNALFEKKNHDYGDSFSETYRKLGIISAVTQITHKYNRLVEIATSGQQQVADETLEDTLIDLANYSIMTVMELHDERIRKQNEVKSNE